MKIYFNQSWFKFSIYIYILLYFCSPGIDRFGVDNHIYFLLFTVFSVFNIFHDNFFDEKITFISFLELLYLVFSFVILYFVADRYISTIEFFGAYLNIASTIIVALFIYNAFFSLDFDSQGKSIDFIIGCICIYAFFIYFLKVFSLVSVDDSDFYRNVYGSKLIVKGFFSEPAHFCLMLVSFLNIKLLHFKAKNTNFIYLLVFSSLLIFLSLSVTGIVLLSITLIQYTYRLRYRGIFILLLLLCFLSVFIFSYLFQQLDISDFDLVSRFTTILNGEDNSANFRMVDSWSFLPYILDWRYLIFGVGLGNADVFSLSVMHLNQQFVGINVFANAMFSGGLIFLLLILTRVFLLIKDNKFILFFLLLCFSHGYLVGPFFYPMISVYSALKRDS